MNGVKILLSLYHLFEQDNKGIINMSIGATDVSIITTINVIIVLFLIGFKPLSVNNVRDRIQYIQIVIFIAAMMTIVGAGITKRLVGDFNLLFYMLPVLCWYVPTIVQLFYKTADVVINRHVYSRVSSLKYVLTIFAIAGIYIQS